ncbi:MAG TPA: RraA family protein [Verrucomicrobiae bacterium]|jgi:regulator of RNase E activity RraA|nr:RraA family protein [Verrucomicrobiae bacterium]
MKPAPTAEQLENLRRIDACTLANAIETFHERLRDEGFVDHSVACLYPKLPPVVGFAATVRIRGSSVPTAGGIYPDRTDWWDYILSLPAPRIVVVEDVATKTGLGSLLGAVHANILKALGCVGALTNGSVRDVPAIEQLGFQVFAGGICVSHAYVHIVEFGMPVNIGGLKIGSGELLHGDRHGVQSIPPDLVEKIPAVAAQIAAKQRDLIELCRSKDFSLDKLRAAIGKDTP